MYRVWLDGREASPHVTTASEFTFPSADFLDPFGYYSSGPRTAYVQAVDAGGRRSNVASATWQVRSPAPDTLQRPRLLLIDDISALEDPAGNFDRFYNAAVTRSAIPAGSWSLLHLESGRPFRSSLDLAQTLRLFDAVVWYRGAVHFSSFSTRDTLITQHADGLAAYLDSGGKLYFEGLDLVASGAEGGLFDPAFTSAYLGSNYLFKNKAPTAADSTISWSISKAFGTTPVILHSTVFADSLKSNTAQSGLRAFGVRDTNDVLLWARDSSLVPQVPTSLPVGVRVALASGGRVVATSVPIAPLSGYAGSTARFIDAIFVYLGIKP